jgi:hypothetical protein
MNKTLIVCATAALIVACGGSDEVSDRAASAKEASAAMLRSDLR